MDRIPVKMELEEWEIINDTNQTFLDFGLESGKDLLFSKEISYCPNGIIDMDYFMDPAQPCKIMEVTKHETVEDDVYDQEYKDIGIMTPPQSTVIITDQPHVASEVFLEKWKHDEFVNMKIEYPMIDSIMSSTETESILFEDKGEILFKDDKNLAFEKEGLETEKECVESEIKEKPCWKGSGIRIWRWKVAGGIGTLCSLGVAAATICIFIVGRGQQQKQQQYHSPKIQFQIYADEKVMQHATRMNQALSAVRGAPTMRANISFGGYYEGL